MKLINVESNVTMLSIKTLVYYGHRVIQGDNLFTKKLSVEDTNDWIDLGFNVVIL